MHLYVLEHPNPLFNLFLIKIHILAFVLFPLGKILTLTVIIIIISQLSKDLYRCFTELWKFSLNDDTIQRKLLCMFDHVHWSRKTHPPYFYFSPYSCNPRNLLTIFPRHKKTKRSTAGCRLMPLLNSNLGWYILTIDNVICYVRMWYTIYDTIWLTDGQKKNTQKRN